MKKFTSRIKSILVASMLAASLTTSAAAQTQQATDNRDAFGEAYSFTNILFEVYMAVHDEDARDDATADVLAYAENYAIGENRLLIENAVANIEWTDEWVAYVIALIMDSSFEYLGGLNDEQLWYSDFGMELTSLLWWIALGAEDLIEESGNHLIAILEDGPAELDPFLDPVLEAIVTIASEDDLDADEIQAILDELELVARRDQ